MKSSFKFLSIAFLIACMMTCLFLPSMTQAQCSAKSAQIARYSPINVQGQVLVNTSIYITRYPVENGFIMACIECRQKAINQLSCPGTAMYRESHDKINHNQGFSAIVSEKINLLAKQQPVADTIPYRRI